LEVEIAVVATNYATNAATVEVTYA